MFDMNDHLNKLEQADGAHRYYCPNCGGNDLTVSESGAYNCWHGCTPAEIRNALDMKGGSMSFNAAQEGRVRVKKAVENGHDATYIFRGIEPLQLKKYGVKFVKRTVRNGAGQYVSNYEAYLPYYDKKDGTFSDYKVVSLKDKKIKWLGDGTKTNAKHAAFFGEQLATRKTLLITEGEWDAPAANFMLEGSVSCVSIPFGAASAAKYIKSRLDWVEKFNKVYICFDQDDPGIKAADEVMALLRPGLAYRMNLKYKDANTYLQRIYDPKTKAFKSLKALEEACMEFKEAFWAAKQYSPEFIFNEWDGMLHTIAGEDDINVGVSTGFRQLDRIMGGMRKEEVTTIFADPAEGKSSVARHIAAHRLAEGDKVMLVSLEEPVKKNLMELFCHLFKRNVYPNDGIPRLVGKDLGLAKKYFTDQIVPVSMTCNQTVEKVREVLEYGVRMHDVDVIVYDNVTAGVAGDDKAHQSIDKLYSTLQSIAKEFGVHVLAVSHTKRRENTKRPPMMTDGYGSGGIERFSNTVITLHQSTMRVVKNRNTGEKGEFRIYWDAINRCFLEELTSYDTQRKEESSTSTGGVLRQSNGSSGCSHYDEVGTDTEQEQTASSSREVGGDNEPGLEDSWEVKDDIRGAEGGTSGRTVGEEHQSPSRSEPGFHQKLEVSGTFPKPYIAPPNQANFRRLSYEIRGGMGVFTDAQRAHFRRAYLASHPG